jgi:hypothetical protein
MVLQSTIQEIVGRETHLMSENIQRENMKKRIQRLGNEFLSSNYPIKDLVEGWFFKVQEVSNGVYEVEGIDYWGRKVSHKGIDVDEVLKLCAKDAQDIKASLEE